MAVDANGNPITVSGGFLQPRSTIQSPTGEQPLSDDYFSGKDQTQINDAFKYGAKGGPVTGEYETFQDFKTQFGRNPTQSELSMLAPNYYGGMFEAGKGAIASYYNSLSNNPSNIAANQQKQALDSYNKNPTQFDSQTNQIFQKSLGRNANSDEATHFGSLLASGQIDSYGMSQLVGQSQEAQQRQTQQYQTQLQQNLQGTQSDYYNKYILPGIQAQFASQGRDVNSSGFSNAAIQAGKQQNYDLQNYLAQFGAGQYGQSAQNQQNVYQQYLANQYGLQNAGIQQQLGQQAYMQQRNAQLQDYQIQQQAYNNYLQQFGKRSNGLGGLIGGGVGAIAGSFFGPAGTAAGWQLGSGLGQGIQGQTQGQSYNMQPNQGFNYGGLPTSWGGSSQQQLPYGQI